MSTLGDNPAPAIRGEEPAYPLPNWDAFPWSAGTPAFFGTGLSKRELYAGMAMQGIIAGGYGDTIPHDDVAAGRSVAHFAVMYADALLAELEKPR